MQTERGTKRTCQNEACGARFYDLVRDPITCPICHTTFLPPPPRSSQPKAAWKTNRSAFKRPIVEPAPVVAAKGEAAEENLDEPAETEDTETTIVSEKPDLILELDEEDDDEVNVVEMPVTGDEKG
ncbi:MAG: TIGR02300 family protein [bacterium]|nr:TIGR02300 family protein [bacterium]